MKQIISVIITVCLLASLLAGCGGEDGGRGSVPMGRYIEERGEILENLSRVYGFHKAEDGSIAFYGRYLKDGAPVYSRYSLPTGGGALVREEQDWIGGFIGEGSLRDVSEAPDGTVYLLYNYNGGMDTAVARRAPGGAPERIAVAELGSGGADSGMNAAPAGSVSMGVAAAPEDKAEEAGEEAGGADVSAGEGVAVSGGDAFYFSGYEMYASGLAALDDGFLLLFGGEGIFRYQSDGTKREEYPGNAYGDVAVYGSTLLTPSPDGGELWTYDLDAAKQTGSYTYDNLNFGTRVGLDGGGIYLSDTSGIYRQASGGTIWERLVDGGLTTLIMPNVTMHGLVPDEGDGFFALINLDEDTYQLMHYVYDPNTPTDPDTELTIFSLQDNSTIRQAIGEFQRANPNVRVNFRIAMDESGAATAEDVIRALNTEILSGKGPDILLLDGLPVNSYIEKGVLLDLTGLVDRQVVEQGLLSNLMNAYSRDGKIYGVPSKFTVPVMMGPADEVDAVRSLSRLAERTEAGVSEQPPFLRAPETLWDENWPGMLMQYYDALSSGFLKNGVVDQKALAEYFAAMLRIDRAVKEYTPQVGGSAIMVTVAGYAGGGFEPLDMGVSDLKKGLAQFHITELSGLFALSNLSDNLGGMGGQKLAGLFGEKRYTPVGGVGVLASGKQQELAQSFVELLLSPTVQDSYVYDGYPVNGASLDKLTKEILEGGDGMGFTSLCRALDTPVLIDDVVKDAAIAQAKGLLDGSLTPEQAAANVAEKTELYLSE